VARLEDGIHKSLQDPELVARLEREGEEVSTGTPDAFAALLRADLGRYQMIVKKCGVKPALAGGYSTEFATHHHGL
jgi:tripartite-type tricarboxylate transporter receptor subunit TctC